MPGKSHPWGIAVVIVVLALIAPASGAAKTFEPTRKDDPVPDGCKPNDCSLREAFQSSNQLPGHDTILLGRGRYELVLPNDSAGFDNGSLDMVDSFTLRGQGAGKTTIDANGLDQVTTGWNNGSANSFTFQRLTLTGGDANAGYQNDGGAILAVEPDRLRVSSVRIIGNKAPTSGGGIAVLGPSTGNPAPTGAARISKSVIVQNQAMFGGGVESRDAKLIVSSSTIHDNLASEGGGIDLRPEDYPPVTKIKSSTISANYGTTKGGGILVDGNPYGGAPNGSEEPELYVSNSTIADNRTNGDGGGLMGDNAAVLDIENSSIGFNQANNDANNSQAGVGGGVYQHGNANFSVDDSVIAHNAVLGAMGSDPDCSATEVFSGAGNAISDTEGCDVSFTTPFNVYSANPIAANLADNGGLTQTMALVPGSAAIGFANACPKRDQRGRLRPANCDSGAFEKKPRSG